MLTVAKQNGTCPFLSLSEAGRDYKTLVSEIPIVNPGRVVFGNGYAAIIKIVVSKLSLLT